jgi:hypothetical protein
MWVFPDGFTALFRAAAALPALLGTPVLEVLPAALPVVVPPVEDPAVAPPVAAPPVPELPPAEPPLDCASAKLLVSASAVANPNVASFMIAPFLVASWRNTTRSHAFLSGQSQIVAVPWKNSALETWHWTSRRKSGKRPSPSDTFHIYDATEDCSIELAALSRPLRTVRRFDWNAPCPLLSSLYCSTSP